MRRHIEVPANLERSHPVLVERDEVEESARVLLTELCEELGVDDLGATRCLDIGCGVKFTRLLINEERPILRYVGIDVSAPVIEFLTAAVSHPAFRHVHFDVHNERYNPGGSRLDQTSGFPIGEEHFDVCLAYSLFTHLDPDDSRTTLAHMRAAVDEGGRASFTAFLDEHSESGHGWVDQFSRGMGESVEGITEGTFIDAFPDDPLLVAVYDREYLTGLLEKAGWRLDRVRDPSPNAQHTIVATAV